LACVSILIIACTPDKLASPKPRQYPRVEFPEKSSQKFSERYCDMTFDFPGYAHIEQEKNFFEDSPESPCWFDIVMPSLNGRIHCSYYKIKGKESLENLIQDAFSLVGKHNIKANYRSEIRIKKAGNINGIWFEIDGPVATPFQFYVTDSTDHFFRASLYFNNTVAPDSMAPIYQFVKEDMLKMVNTFQWTD
jgi:gliding motility-associated lipoprotein GldD